MMMNTDQAADYLTNTLGVPVRATTLKRKRFAGGGPLFHRFGRIALYAPHDLDAWAKEQISTPRSSTSEPA